MKVPRFWNLIEVFYAMQMRVRLGTYLFHGRRRYSVVGGIPANMIAHSAYPSLVSIVTVGDLRTLVVAIICTHRAKWHLRVEFHHEIPDGVQYILWRPSARHLLYVVIWV